MLIRNVEIAKEFLRTLNDYCEIIFITGSSIYKSSGSADIDLFLIIKNENLLSIDQNVSEFAKSARSEKAINKFVASQTNFISYLLNFKSTDIDLVIMSNSLFMQITENLSDHFAITSKTSKKISKRKKRYLKGVNNSIIPNTYSYTNKSDQTYEFPINVTINNMYFAHLPLSNILGPSLVVKGEELFKKRLINLTSLIDKIYGTDSWKNLTFLKSDLDIQ